MSETADKTGRALSAQEKSELKSRLTKAYEELTPYSIKLSKQINMDIVTVVHCCQPKKEGDKIPADEKELLDLAYMLATDSSWYHFRKEAKSYVDEYRTEMDDLYQEYFLLVRKELINYNPEFDIITFLMHRVKPVFSTARTKGTGSAMSKHYRDAGVKIRNAENELAKIGNTNPSAEDIQEYITGTTGKEMSITTILRYRAQNPDYREIDLTRTASSGPGPEDTAIANEEKRLFYDAMQRLSSKYRLVFTLQLDYESRYGKLPTIQELCVMLKKEGYDYTERRVSNLVTAANQQFSRYYKRGKRRSEAPVNRLVFRDITTEDEDEDIINAIRENIDVID